MCQMSAKWRDRKFLLVLYPDDPSHVDAVARLESSGTPFAGILHDKDVWADSDDDLEGHIAGELKKPHWHFVVRFKQARWSTALAAELGIDDRYIRKCNAFEAALLYLIHDGFPDKYQYDFTDVFGSLCPNLAKLLVADDEGSRVLEIVRFIDETDGILTYRRLLIMACENGLYGDFRKLGSGAKWLLDEHNSYYALPAQRGGLTQNQIELARFDGFAMGHSARDD